MPRMPVPAPKPRRLVPGATPRRLPPRLAGEVRRFAVANARFKDPDWAYGACCLASGDFAAKVPGARVVHLLGSRRSYPLRNDDYPPRDPEYYHAVVVVDGFAIDWTRRQLDPHCAFPFVQTVDELRREWLRVAPNAAALGL